MTPLSCPYCGCDAQVIKYVDNCRHMTFFYAECSGYKDGVIQYEHYTTKCRVFGEVSSTEEGAIQHWNSLSEESMSIVGGNYMFHVDNVRKMTPEEIEQGKQYFKEHEHEFLKPDANGNITVAIDTSTGTMHYGDIEGYMNAMHEFHKMMRKPFGVCVKETEE